MSIIDDNKCFTWSLVRYLNPVDHNPKRITNADKYFAMTLDFKGIKFPAKFRDIYKIEKRIPLGLEVLVMKIRKNIQLMYQKDVMKKNMLIY